MSSGPRCRSSPIICGGCARPASCGSSAPAATPSTRSPTPGLQALLPLLDRLTGRIAPAPPEPDDADGRTCYDHLGGRLGVALYDRLLERDGAARPAGRHRRVVDAAPLRALGVDVAAIAPGPSPVRVRVLRRPPARAAPGGRAGRRAARGARRARVGGARRRARGPPDRSGAGGAVSAGDAGAARAGGDATTSGRLAALRASIAEQAARAARRRRATAALLDITVGQIGSVCVVRPRDWDQLRHEEGGEARPVPVLGEPVAGGQAARRRCSSSPRRRPGRG